MTLLIYFSDFAHLFSDDTARLSEEYEYETFN